MEVCINWAPDDDEKKEAALDRLITVVHNQNFLA